MKKSLTLNDDYHDSTNLRFVYVNPGIDVFFNKKHIYYLNLSGEKDGTHRTGEIRMLRDFLSAILDDYRKQIGEKVNEQ